MSPRPSASQRGYGTAWVKARAGYLRSHPCCVMCMKTGITTQATIVDHIKPHRGSQALFWDKANWQPLCKPHHDSSKQRMENGRIVRLIGADGWPVD